MPLIDIIAGARPNFMKVAPIIRCLDGRSSTSTNLAYRLVHTGQHHDRNMSELFFEQLGLPAPDEHLGVTGGSHAAQTGAIMVSYENLLSRVAPDVTLVVGDVNSTLACALVARKCGVPVAHVEAGLRSGDWSMPEEVNRVATDAVSSWYFTTTESAGRNLQREGVSAERIFLVGNTMIDSLNSVLGDVCRPQSPELHELAEKGYLLLTVHRPANVDATGKLRRQLEAIATAAGRTPVVFPVHPRTQRSLQQVDRLPSNILRTEPLGYREFIYLLKHSIGVITDSGGITEEATVLGVPCITLRPCTERPETVEIGTNELVGDDLGKLNALIAEMIADRWKSGSVPPMWDGCSGSRIVDCLESILK